MTETQSTPSETPAISFSARLEELAEQIPQATAITMGSESISFSEFNRAANRFARRMLDLGVESGDFVTIAEPNSIEFLLSTAACWKIGAIPQPVSARLPGLELQQIVELAKSKLVVGADVSGWAGDWQGLPAGAATDTETAALTDTPLPDVVCPAWKAPTSGGSTGTPKLIVSGDPSIHSQAMKGLAKIIGAAQGETMVMPGPLYHNGPFIWSCYTLLTGGQVALLPRFNAEQTLAEIERHNATAVYLVPTMMQRIWKLDDDVKFGYDISSLRVAFHLAEPCPGWLKEAWIDWIGPDVLYELYGGTEGQMFTVIDGNNWLERPGSVGKPLMGEIKICDPDGNELPAGTDGEVWMRNTARETPTYRYNRCRVGTGRRWLGIAWRHGQGRRGWLPVSRRPTQGHDSRRWRQYLPRRDRSGHRRSSRCVVVGGDRTARRGQRQRDSRHRATISQLHSR